MTVLLMGQSTFEHGIVTDGATINGVFKIGATTVTSSAAELNRLDGALVSYTELNYLVGTTGPIQTQLGLKATIASPTFTGTVGGITKSMVGLGNVTNESKATMFTSPTFTGTPVIPATITLAGESITGVVDVEDVAILKHPDINAKVASYVLVLGDDGDIITMENGGATNITVPTNAAESFPVGAKVEIYCIGAGVTTIVFTGGVTGISEGNHVAITAKGHATLRKLLTNTWHLSGDIQ